MARTESEFDPISFETEAARAFGRISAAASGLPLYTTNPGDYEGLDGIVDVIAVSRPQ